MLRRSGPAVLAALVLSVNALAAQENPVRRVANIVSVAVEEYARGVDENGRLVSDIEYREATEFLADARSQAARLPGERAARALLLLDSLVAGVADKRKPSDIRALEQRFAGVFGSEAALELPRAALDLARGRRLYETNCATCHGITADGKGPQGAGLNPPPPPLGDPVAMHDRSPAAMFRVTSVGIGGTPMVGFGSRLSIEDRWNIVAYLVSLHATPQQVAEGEGLYTQGCMSCHGALGAGDGAFARSLTRLPGEIGSLAYQSARSDKELGLIVRNGLPGTAMPPSPALTDRQLQNVVAYLRTMPARTAPAAGVVADAQTDAGAAARRVLSLVEQSVNDARAGRTGDAGDRAFDAYIAFEPMETRARAKSPGLVANMEKYFSDLRGAASAGDVRAAERARDVIETTMPTIVQLTQPPGSGVEAFWQSFLIIFREGLEAILVIGAIVAFLLRTGNRDRLKSIWMGVAAALAASAVTAVILKTVLAAMPATREVIEGITMLIAVAVLFSVSYWLISKVEAAKWQQFIRDKVNVALEHGGSRALALVAFLAVYREGAETALFYQALFNEGGRVILPLALGFVVGGVALAVIFTAFYRFGVRVPLRPLFGATSVLLYYMAFVFMGKGMRELQEGNVVSITIIPGAPTADLLGIYPTVETLAAQLVLVTLFVIAMVKTFWPKRSVTLPTIPGDSTATALVEAQLADLRSAQEALEHKLARIEAALGREPSESRSDD